jgi:hypothetical protein
VSERLSASTSLPPSSSAAFSNRQRTAFDERSAVRRWPERSIQALPVIAATLISAPPARASLNFAFSRRLAAVLVRDFDSERIDARGCRSRRCRRPHDQQRETGSDEAPVLAAQPGRSAAVGHISNLSDQPTFFFNRICRPHHSNLRSGGRKGRRGDGLLHRVQDRLSFQLIFLLGH